MSKKVNDEDTIKIKDYIIETLREKVRIRNDEISYLEAISEEAKSKCQKKMIECDLKWKIKLGQLIKDLTKLKNKYPLVAKETTQIIDNIKAI